MGGQVTVTKNVQPRMTKYHQAGHFFCKNGWDYKKFSQRFCEMQ